MLRVHDTMAHDCSNTQPIGYFMSCCAEDQYSVKVILSVREVRSSTQPTLQLLLQFCCRRTEKTEMLAFITVSFLFKPRIGLKALHHVKSLSLFASGDLNIHALLQGDKC